MLQRLSFLLLACLALAACDRDVPTAASTPAADTVAPAATNPAPEVAAPVEQAAPAPEAAVETPAPSEAGAPVDAQPQPAPAEASAEAPAPTPAPAPPAGPEPKEGEDYFVIPGGQPWAPVAGKIEVVEVFGYTCPHCATFEPLVQNWKQKQPADVNFVQVPAAFGGIWVPFARAYFAAEAMGLLDKTHDDLFKAIHIERSLRSGDEDDIADFYAKYGADADAFASTMNSFAVAAKLSRAQQAAQRWGIEGTPTLVVNGKYRVVGGRAGGQQGELQTAEWLIAKERAAQ